MFNPTTDIPNLSGKVIFITGATAGLGKQTLLTLASHSQPPAHIYFTGRNPTTGEAVITEIKAKVPNVNLTFVALDLGSLASIKSAISGLHMERLDILICNAGVMAIPAALTKDGYEVQFGTNHLGHALIIRLLLPVLLQTVETNPENSINSGRIVILTSQGFSLHPTGGIVFKDLRTVQESTFGPWVRYGQSKLANVLYASELSRRYGDKITSLSVHPGVIKTGLVTGLSWKHRALIHLTTIGKTVSLEEGTWNTLWASTVDKGGVVNGEFYEPVGKPGKHARESKNEKLAGELWEWTENQLEEYLR
ncbi:oxidoreductase [Cyathus striatus]|nr:oxidoreductase [Cyathus striatus]